MSITHATIKAPGQTLAAVADWNAEHKIEKVNDLPAIAEEAEVIYLNTDKHLYLNQTGG